ncbi:MAG: hypothetical protein U0930_11845 [Pirellulales bacterium]
MNRRILFLIIAFCCCTTLACSKRPKSFAETMREKYANDAFTISLRNPLPDGRPVIGIDWAAKKQHEKEPLRGYLLLVRRNGTPYYTRIFSSHEFRPGFSLDIALNKSEFKQNDVLSVRVEVNIDSYAKDCILLSNSLNFDLPPDSAADFSTPPQ